MKYSPCFNPFRNFKYTSKKQLAKHLDLVGLYPGERKPYYCTLCDKTFSTQLGASNHVNFIHTREVFEILNEGELSYHEEE